MRYSDFKNNRYNSALSLMELLFAITILGVISIGAIKLYKYTSIHADNVEIEASLLELKQHIRTQVSCAAMRNQANEKTSTCGLRVLNKLNQDVGGSFHETGSECSVSNPNPFDVGYHTFDGRIDYTVANISSEGAITIWARLNPQWLSRDPEVRKSFLIKGAGLFADAPIICKPDECWSDGTFTEEWQAASGQTPASIGGWTLRLNNGGTASHVSFDTDGKMRISNSNRSNYVYYRNDNLDFPCGAHVMEIRAKVASSNVIAPDRAPLMTGMGINGQRYVEMGVKSNEVYFSNGSCQPSGDERFLVVSPFDATVWHTYRLESDKNGNVKFFVDGVLNQTFVAPVCSGAPSWLRFGDATVEAYGDVRYEFFRHNFTLK